MKELLEALEAEIAALLTGEQFDDPANAGEKAGVQVCIGSLPPKRSGQQNENDFPFVVIRPMAGSAGDRKTDVTVRLLAAVYTAGDVVAGIAAIDRLVEILQQLRKKRVRGDYTMQQHIGWQYGDGDGRHAHPFYDAEITLGFNRAKAQQC